MLYVKFTADAVTEFLLLSFKRKVRKRERPCVAGCVR
jgi:hypothetical protein